MRQSLFSFCLVMYHAPNMTIDKTLTGTNMTIVYPLGLPKLELSEPKNQNIKSQGT